MFKKYLVHILAIHFVFSLSLKGQDNDFPYELNTKGYVVTTFGLGAKLTADYIENNKAKMTIDELLALDKNDINSFDRSATNKWNEQFDKTSDLTRNIIIAAPIVILGSTAYNKQWKNSLSYGFMYFETALLTLGLTDLTKALTNRTRPYLYNTNIPIEQRTETIENENVYDSFYSGHTAISFASAVFLSSTYTQIYGKSTWSKIIWGSSLTLAASTGYLRYASGQHFPTDVIMGAVAGSAIGYLIPYLHQKEKNKHSLMVTPNSLYYAYTF